MSISPNARTWILRITGALTATMLYGAFAPQAALQSMFGAALQGPVAEIVVRNWALLIALIGALLIYAASHPPVQGLVLVLALVSKLAFIGLVLGWGAALIGPALALTLAADGVMVLLFAACLREAGQG